MNETVHTPINYAAMRHGEAMKQIVIAAYRAFSLQLNSNATLS